MFPWQHMSTYGAAATDPRFHALHPQVKANESRSLDPVDDHPQYL
jgi:hypothetical protein